MRAIWMIVVLAIGAGAFYGCGGGDAYAQGVEHYVGRRIYIQSLVYDLRNRVRLDGEGDSVHIPREGGRGIHRNFAAIG